MCGITDQAGNTEYFYCDEEGRQETYINRNRNVVRTLYNMDSRLTYTGQMYDGATGQYYLHARFYNPMIGRFLQEDAYRGDGLNLYAYCANNPVAYYAPSGNWGLCPNGKLEPTNGDFDRIRNYRDVALTEIDPKDLAHPEFIVEIPFCGKGNKNSNSQGWLQQQKYFYNELSKAHPELLSDANLRRIANGQALIVDEQFVKYFPQNDNYMNELLRHHHIGGGGQAMPVPDSLHLGYGGIHNIEKAYGIWGGADAINSDFLQAIKTLTERTKFWKNVRIKLWQ